MSEEKIGLTGIFVFQQLTLILLSGNLTLQVKEKISKERQILKNLAL